MEIGRYYRCIRGIQQYGTNLDYFISGKIYKCSDELYLIDELGEDHLIHHSILKSHFELVYSNKRKRNDKERRQV